MKVRLIPKTKQAKNIIVNRGEIWIVKRRDKKVSCLGNNPGTLYVLDNEEEWRVNPRKWCGFWQEDKNVLYDEEEIDD